MTQARPEEERVNGEEVGYKGTTRMAQTWSKEERVDGEEVGYKGLRRCWHYNG